MHRLVIKLFANKSLALLYNGSSGVCCPFLLIILVKMSSIRVPRVL